MTSQQLLEARAARWRHHADPILTLEDAASWVESHGFLLFLPRKQQLPAPAPSFVEACLGRLEHTPSRAAIEDALSLARRLFADGSVIPLNLFGTLSEEPDFLMAREELPWLLSLRADRSWKSAPSGRTSPLHVHIWKLLDEQGALTVEEIRSGVGREVTEAAVRRALVEMWGTLRVVPHYQTGPTEWRLVKAAYPQESAKGAATAQATALSFFIAGYLRSVIAASKDEITTFLSPLASRSKVSEVLHALLASRQLETLALGPSTLYHIAGALPEFPEAALPAASDREPVEIPAKPPAPVAQPADGSTERIRRYLPQHPSSRDERPRRSDRGAGQKPYERQRSSNSREGATEHRPLREGKFPPRSQSGGWLPRGKGNQMSGGQRPLRSQPDEGGAFADNRRSRPGNPRRPEFGQRQQDGRSAFARGPLKKTDSGGNLKKRKPFPKHATRNREEFPSGLPRDDRAFRGAFGDSRRDGRSSPGQTRSGKRQSPVQKFGRQRSSVRDDATSHIGGETRPTRRPYGKSGSARPSDRSYEKNPGRGFGGKTKRPGKDSGKPKRRPEE